MIEKWFFREFMWTGKPLHPKDFSFFYIFLGKNLLHWINLVIAFVLLTIIMVLIRPEHITISSISTLNTYLNESPYFLAICLMLFSRTILITLEAYVGVRRGETWFNTEELEELEIRTKDLNQRLDASTTILKQIVYNGGINIEQEFAIIATDNRIEKLQVADSVGKHRGLVTIDISWRASTQGNPILYLYKDEGEMQVNVDDIRNRCTAIRLDFHKQGEPIHFIDANVMIGKSYNYYAWIEVEIYSHLLVLHFKKQSHIVKEAETFEGYFNRVAKNVQTKHKLEALKVSKTPTTTSHKKLRQELDVIMRIYEGNESKKERVNKIDKFIQSLPLEEEEKENLLANALSEIQKIENEPDE